MREEIETRFHVLYLSIFTALYVLLSAATWFLGWERGMIWIFLLIVIVAWGIHLAKVWTGLWRLAVYALLSGVGILFCGYHPRTISDMSVVLLIMIVLFSVQREMRLIYLAAAYYPVLILENIFVNHYLTGGRDGIVYVRLILCCVSIISVVLVSRFFIRRDLREREEFEKVQRELETAKGENEQFLSNVSHELRTPINAVNGISELLLHRELSERVLADVGIIRDAGKRLMRQVDDIMCFSELHTGRFFIQNENYEPVSALREVIEEVFEKSPQKQLEIAIDMETTVPKVLYGDIHKISKILVCILENALKFTNEGGMYLYISKRDEEYGVNLNIDLWDTGIGMSLDERRHLYRGRIYKKDSGSKRKIGGTGLGMAIVQGIVMALDGFMTIDSEEGQGSHFHISIPQQVRNVEPGIHISNASEFRCLVYFNMEKYVRPQVGEFYRRLVSHIRDQLRIDAQEMTSLEQLKTTLAQGKYTHVFVAKWEYEMDSDYFEQLSRQIKVVVFADDSFVLSEDSQITKIRKPVDILSIVNYLKKDEKEHLDEVQKNERKIGNQKPLLLVVDDDEMNLIVAKGILESLQMRVETVTGGAQAIKACQEKCYDMVLMDYMMPGMNGTEAMKRIRELRDGYYRDIPILAVSANAVSTARADFLRAGFDEFVPKPIEITVLERALSRVMEEEGYDD